MGWGRRGHGKRHPQDCREYPGRVSICALDRSEDYAKRLLRKDIQVHLLPGRKAGMDWCWIPRLVRLFRSKQVDVIHSHKWGALIFCAVAARLAGIGWRPGCRCDV